MLINVFFKCNSLLRTLRVSSNEWYNKIRLMLVTCCWLGMHREMSISGIYNHLFIYFETLNLFNPLIYEQVLYLGGESLFITHLLKYLFYVFIFCWLFKSFWSWLFLKSFCSHCLWNKCVFFAVNHCIWMNSSVFTKLILSIRQKGGGHQPLSY